MPPVAFSAMLEPAQIATPDPALMTGKVFTVTVVVAVFVQPAAVPVTVYVVDTVGLTVTVAPTVELMAVLGDQV